MKTIKKTRGVVISLCDYTGNMVKPWANAGYDCICIDIQHSIRNHKKQGHITYMWGDIRAWWPEFKEIEIVFAFPPCTNLAVSGARDFQKKGLTGYIDGLLLVEHCRRICEASGAPWMLENPVSRLSTAWRKPDYSFNPCDYAGYLINSKSEAYTKKTCLWTGCGFIMPKPKRIKPVLGSKMHFMTPGENRANERSATPRGFAKAVFLANKK